MPSFHHNGHRLAYTVHGHGSRAMVLLPGLLLSQKMQTPLAKQLARRGNRVITLDPLGHGASDRPTDPSLYSMGAFAEQTVALLDHLELERAVVGGTSMGANITLEMASLAPQRLQGMIVEMPVLDHAVSACAAAFSPLLLALTLGRPAMGALARVGRAIPRTGVPFLAELGLDWLSQDPEPSGAVLQGLLFGRTAPPHQERVTFDVPALIIGHPRDPIHPFSDADMLATELPHARLIDASSMIELRTSPARLTGEIAEFLDTCWRERPSRPSRKAASA